jgi:hypothetical protein
MDIKITRLVAAPVLNIVLELKLVHLIIHHVFALPLAGSRCIQHRSSSLPALIQHRSSSLPALNIDRALSPALVLKSAYFDRCELTTDRFRKKAKHLFLLLLVQSLRILFGSRRSHSVRACIDITFAVYHSSSSDRTWNSIFTTSREDPKQTIFPFELK